MHKIILLFSICLSLTVKAQTITGVVVDTTYRETVPYAFILISYPDTTDRCFSDEEGRFSFTPYKFPLRVKAQIRGITSDSVCLETFPDDAFITIPLANNAIELDEVTVTGHNRLTSLTDNGLSYRMSANKRAQNENALQSLSYVPLVGVDANGAITVQGSSSYSLYLNGRPYEMAETSPKAFLETLPASAISRVEVITNPTARMGPDANLYIINIVLKKDLTDGYIMNVGAGGNTQPAANGSLLGMARKGNVNVSLTYDYGLNGQRNQPVTLDYSQPASDGSSSSHWTTCMRGNGNWHTHTLRTMFKWQIDSLNTLYADVHGRINRTDIVGKEWSVSDGSDPDNSYIDNISRYTSGTVEANAVYRNYPAHDRNTERFTLGYHFTYNPDKRHFSQRRYEDGLEATDTYQYTDGGMSEHTGLLSYFWQIHPRHSIRFSFKDTYRVGDTHSVDREEEEQYASMNYHNNIAEGAVTWSGGIRNAGIEGTIRFNHDYFRMRLPQTPDNDFSNRHLYIIPSASIYWMPGSKYAFFFRYATSILRPTVQMLNPFVSVSNDNTVREGNPNLKAQYTHNLSLNVFFNGLHNLSLVTGFSCSHVRDVMQEYVYLNDDDKIVSTYGNMGTADRMEVIVNAQWDATKWLMIAANGNAGVRYMTARSISLNQKDWYYSFSPECRFLLPKHYSLSITEGIYKSQPKPWAERNPLIMYAFSANKSFLSGRLNVSVSANSPFSKYHKSIERTTLPTIYIRQTNFITARSFGIRLSYSFGAGRKVDMQRDQTMKSTDQTTGVN